ncbi:MAG: carboxypeptidase regulatory-like domain-containing protein [Pseudomonadota bacterium]
MQALSVSCAAAALCLGAVAAHAQDKRVLPPLHMQGSAGYVCGGIGVDESTLFRSAMKSHPLSLLFARPGGDYLADVQVDIKAHSGDSVLSMTAGGPVCLIDLPAGRYTIAATSGGTTKNETVTVGSGGSKTADFRF